MTRSSFALVCLWLAGCVPPPPVVHIDWSQVSTQQALQVVPQPPPISSSVPNSLQGSVGAKSVRLLQEKEGIELWEDAKQTLTENRNRSLERLREDLERRYLGDERSAAIEAEAKDRVLDDADWEQTMAQFRAVLERYADQKAPLLAELAGFIGFPDQDKKLPRRTGEEVYRKFREKQVADLKAQIKALDEAFEQESKGILVAYEQRKRDRLEVRLERDLAGDQAAIARAEADAAKFVRGVIGSVNSAIPDLAKRLEALPAKTVTAQSAKPLQPDWGNPSQIVGMGEKELSEYANVFVKSRGWKLDEGTRGKDVTKEFLEWLEKNAPGR
ncbi:MAG: hypothetical protein KF836_04035 [Fimbriimonadaceae bacterium]|nr:hypothetical protein [Fimbriimonadaceae bacterium]